ncbi:uncharacterized protein METZ01_LOCUS262254, partial [marine metagenome]
GCLSSGAGSPLTQGRKRFSGPRWASVS